MSLEEATVSSQRRSGRLEIQTNGTIYDGKGWFSYDPAHPVRESIVGADGRVHGYKEVRRRAPSIEGVITEPGNLDLAALPSYTDVTVFLSFDGGDVVVLRDAWHTGGQHSEDAVKFQGRELERIT